jgi:ParB family chromosome partitioning protein
MRHDAHFVEQLVRADELPVGRRIPIHLIEANPDQPRSAMGDLDELTKSIERKGVLEPILVRQREDGRFTIISGERRFRAALEAGLSEIPCIEMEASDSELLEIALIENLQRKDLTPFEEADGYRALKDRHGYTHEQIAEAVGKSRVSVTEALAVGRLPEPVKEECRRADISSKSFLLELGRLRSEEMMLDAVRAWVAGGDVTRDVLREVKRSVAHGAKRKVSSLKKTYSLDFTPEGRHYRVRLVFLGKGQKKEDVLAAIRDLARRIESGEVDLEKEGRFSKPRKPARSPRIPPLKE